MFTGSAAEKSTVYVDHEFESATDWSASGGLLPRTTFTRTAFDPPTPFALNVTRYVPFRITKFESMKNPNDVLMLATCPVPAAETRMHCRPSVPGGRSADSVVIVAPPNTCGGSPHPMSAPPGKYFSAMK